MTQGMVIQGRNITAVEIGLIRNLMAEHSDWGRVLEYFWQTLWDASEGITIHRQGGRREEKCVSNIGWMFVLCAVLLCCGKRR